MEDLIWGVIDGLIAWPTLIVNVFGGDYQVFQDSRGDGWYAFGFLLVVSAPFAGAAGSGAAKRR
jgi:hypothetical protein